MFFIGRSALPLAGCLGISEDYFTAGGPGEAPSRCPPPPQASGPRAPPSVPAAGVGGRSGESVASCIPFTWNAGTAAPREIDSIYVVSTKGRSTSLCGHKAIAVDKPDGKIVVNN